MHKYDFDQFSILMCYVQIYYDVPYLVKYNIINYNDNSTDCEW